MSLDLDTLAEKSGSEWDFPGRRLPGLSLWQCSPHTVMPTIQQCHRPQRLDHGSPWLTLQSGPGQLTDDQTDPGDGAGIVPQFAHAVRIPEVLQSRSPQFRRSDPGPVIPDAPNPL